MNFNDLVGFYEKIAATKKRLLITDILAALFTEAKNSGTTEDLAKIIYLTQGRLVSEIDEWPKFGLAEKSIIQALVQFTGKNTDFIKKLVNKKGDVGEAAQILLEKGKNTSKSYSLDAFSSKKKSEYELSIEHLYDELAKLAQIKGDRSQDLKIKVLNGILRLCSPESAKYVINIILSDLRIGLADMTIMDSLAIAYTGTKESRSIIQRAYNFFPDLGRIGCILVEQGIDGLQQISITPGIPVQMMLASRIQYPQIQQKLGGGEFIAEYKYDGERVQVHKKGENVWLFSRQLKAITDQYPDVVETVLAQVDSYETIFEGEIVAMDPFYENMLPFQVVSTRKRKYDVAKMVKEVPVCLFGFDILYHNDGTKKPKDAMMVDRPFLERRKLLESIIKTSDSIRLSNQQLIQSTEEMVRYFQEARNKGAEGIMTKKIGEDAIYTAGKRGFLWIKLKGLEGAKMSDSIDLVIIGGSWGKGRRKGTLSAVYGAVWNPDSQNFEYLTKTGSGFTDEDLELVTAKLKKLEIETPPKNVRCKENPDVWVKPEIIIEVMGDELTISNKADAGVTLDNPNGFSLRFPIFQRFREDKGIYQITTTQEIIELYELQE